MKSLPTKDPRKNAEGLEGLEHQNQTLVQLPRNPKHSFQSQFRMSAPTCIKICTGGENQLRAPLTLNRRYSFISFDCGILPTGSNLRVAPLGRTHSLLPVFLITAFSHAYGLLTGCDSKNHGGKFWKCQNSNATKLHLLFL